MWSKAQSIPNPGALPFPAEAFAWIDVVDEATPARGTIMPINVGEASCFNNVVLLMNFLEAIA